MVFFIIFFLAFFTDQNLVAQGINVDFGEGGSTIGRFIQIMLGMAFLSLAPSLIMMVTSFTRIVVVMSFLRNALGLQQSPPNVVLISLSLFLTTFVMEPTFQKAYKDALEPLIQERISEEEAWEKGSAPFKTFMLKNVREKDLQLFFDLSQQQPPEKAEDTSLRVLVPSFMVSELRRAFEIGFLIFIPFLVIDVVVASILMSMGMMMLPPVTISLPFKLVFFVLIDGWHMLSGSLVKSFQLGP